MEHSGTIASLPMFPSVSLYSEHKDRAKPIDALFGVHTYAICMKFRGVHCIICLVQTRYLPIQPINLLRVVSEISIRVWAIIWEPSKKRGVDQGHNSYRVRLLSALLLFSVLTLNHVAN